jgi:outer membrane lipoprotein-sorting protein
MKFTFYQSRWWTRKIFYRSGSDCSKCLDLGFKTKFVIKNVDIWLFLKSRIQIRIRSQRLNTDFTQKKFRIRPVPDSTLKSQEIT